MTPKERAAMQQALEALEELHYSSGTVVAVRKYQSATAALREALDQPVKEVELTDDEIAAAVGSPLDEVYLADFRAVIAAYKEKNLIK